jgi:hypothetical protein
LAKLLVLFLDRFEGEDVEAASSSRSRFLRGEAVDGAVGTAKGKNSMAEGAEVAEGWDCARAMRGR